MFIFKSFLLMAVCLVIGSYSSPIELVDLYEPHQFVLESDNDYETTLVRHVRSPEGGSIDVDVRKDQNGREASVSYNHNLFTSKDGSGTIDAYAQGSRNFDYNRNDFSGGIRGSFRF